MREPSSTPLTVYSTGITGRHPAFLLALAAFGYTLFWYRDLVFWNRVQVFQDLFTFLLPRDYAAHLFARFGWPPLWNPLHGLGRPFAGDLQSAVYYPPYWVLRQLGDPLSFNLSIVFHHWIAAVGAFAWIRYRGLSRPAAALGALCLVFGGAAVSLDHHVIWQRSAAWMPLALYWFERWNAERRAYLFVLLALSLALITLGGQPEMLLLTNVLLLGLLVDRAFDHRRLALMSGVGSLVLANLLVLALCAVQVLPFAELLKQTDRSAGLTSANIVEFSLPPASALAFLLPHAVTDRQGIFHATDAFWQRESQAPLLVSLYIGVSLLLILPGLADMSRFRRRYWGAIACVALMLAMGKYLPGFLWLLTHVPVLRLVRYPEKLVLVVHGVLAMAVAVGLDAVIRRPTRLRGVAIGAAGAALLSAAASWSVARLIAASPALLSHDLLAMAVAFALFGAAAAFGCWRPAAGVMTIMLVAAVDLLRVNGDLLPTADWETVRSAPRSFAALRSTGDPLRIYANRPEQPDAAPFPALFVRARNLMMDEASQFHGVANVFTPGTVNLADSERLLGLISDAPRERAAVILGAFNIAYVTSLTDLSRPGLHEVQHPTDPTDAYVYRVEPLAPRALVAREVLPVAHPEDAIAHVEHGDDPLSRIAVVAGDMPSDLPAAMRGEVTIDLYQPDRITLHARMDTAGLIVVNDAYYAGWYAWVDGAAQPIVRANYFARGVYVSAGNHRIVLAYHPRSHTIGAIISACACALAVSVVAVAGIRTMRRGSSARRHARSEEGDARRTSAPRLARLFTPTVRDIFGPGLVLLFLYHLTFREFYPTPRGVMGHDYMRHLPWLLAGYFWLRTNGPFAVPWTTPAFCGGVPFYPDPENMYYSVAQWLTLLTDPLSAVYGQFLLMAWLGFAGFYVLLRFVFLSSRPAALLGAAVFMFNGFYAHRMLIGHVPFHGFMLLPWVAFFLLRPPTASRDRHWQSGCNVAGAGLLLAYMLQSGMVHAWAPVLLAVVGLALLQALRSADDARFWGQLFGAVIVALALAASKLTAAAAYLTQFPRAAYSIPGVPDAATLLKVLSESLFLGPTENIEDALVNAQWRLGRHEFEYGVTVVPALIIAAATLQWLGNARHRKLTLPSLHTATVAGGLITVLCVPGVLNYYHPALHHLLKQIPLLRSTSTFLRWFCVYIPMLALGAALGMDSITTPRGMKIVMAGLGIAALVAITASADRAYYRAQPYRPEPVQRAYADVQSGGHIPPIVRIGDSTYANDALALGVSPMGCYVAMFGYRLELFPLQTLHAGPALAEQDGQLNVKNPACYWLPAENGCQPGDHFTRAQLNTAAAFLAYAPTEFQWSTRQEVANRVSLAALFGCVAFLLGYALRAAGVVRY